MLRIDDRSRDLHLYVCGKTGMGKTRFLATMVVQDMDCGRPLCVLDPVGGLYQYALHYAAHQVEQLKDHPVRPATVEKLLDRYVFLKLSSPDNPVRVNPLLPCAGETVDNLVDDYMQAVRRMFGPFEEQRRIKEALESVVRIASYLNRLPPNQRPPLPEEFTYPLGPNFIYKFFNFDRPVIEQILQPLQPWRQEDGKLDEALDLWGITYRKFSPSMFEDVIGSSRRVQSFMNTSEARRVFHASVNTLDIPAIVNGGRSLFCDLKGGSKEAVKVLGTFITSKFERVAHRRDAEGGYPHTVVMDEFQRYCTAEMAEDFTQVRQKGLRLVCAHQHIQQDPFHTPEGRAMLATIIGMCRTKAVFAVDYLSGDYLVNEMVQVTHTLPKRTEIERAVTEGTLESLHDSFADAEMQSRTESNQESTGAVEGYSRNYSFPAGEVLLYSQQSEGRTASTHHSLTHGLSLSQGTTKTRTRGTTHGTSSSVTVTERIAYHTGEEERVYNIHQLQKLDLRHCFISIGALEGTLMKTLTIASLSKIYKLVTHNGVKALLERQLQKMLPFGKPAKAKLSEEDEDEKTTEKKPESPTKKAGFVH